MNPELIKAMGTGRSGHEFMCKTCGRWFPTYQALGGHRTGHTRPREREEGEATKAKVRVHECLVCGLGFPMGQALGGHMRRHRPEAPPSAQTDIRVAAPLCWPEKRAAVPKMALLDLDLNSIPAEDDVELTKLTLGLGFGPARL